MSFITSALSSLAKIFANLGACAAWIPDFYLLNKTFQVLYV